MHVFKGQQIKYFLSQVLLSSESSHDGARISNDELLPGKASHPCRMEDGHEMHTHMQQPWRIKHIFNKTTFVFHLIIHTCALWTHRGKFLGLKGNEVYKQKIFTVQISVGKGAEYNTQNRLSLASGLQCCFGCQEYTKFPLKGKSNQFPWGWRHPKTRWGYSISAYAFSERMSSFTLNPCQTTRTGWR